MRYWAACTVGLEIYLSDISCKMRSQHQIRMARAARSTQEMTQLPVRMLPLFQVQSFIPESGRGVSCIAK